MCERGVGEGRGLADVLIRGFLGRHWFRVCERGRAA
jgi:hypothetical protein